MKTIIDELLLLAGVRQGDVKLAPLDMTTLIADVKNRLTYLTSEYQFTITEPDFWPTAAGYGPWVEEVWVNYISNAIKYGGPTPAITLGATHQPNGMIRFWITDTGAGLTPEEQARLFMPFTRLDQAQTRGYGLGLSIVKRIVEKLGGEVGVESVKGEGSSFYFTLPAYPQPDTTG